MSCIVANIEATIRTQRNQGDVCTVTMIQDGGHVTKPEAIRPGTGGST